MAEQEESATEHAERSDFVRDICDIFAKGVCWYWSWPPSSCSHQTAAAERARQDPRDDQGNKVFTVPELHWFRKNAYNIGASRCYAWELGHVVGLFGACLALIDCYPKDLPLADVAELTLMGLRCRFVVGAAFVSLARADDRVDERLQRYLEARRHVDAVDGLIQFDAAPRDGHVIEDLLGKLATLLTAASRASGSAAGDRLWRWRSRWVWKR